MTEDEKNSPVKLVPHPSDPSQAGIQPIVLEYKKRKKKSKDIGDTAEAKYSKGLEDIQILGGNFVRIAQKASKAVYKGIDTYQRERAQSSSKKKDGAIEDFIYNSAKGASDFMKETSDIPVDLAESINTKSYRKRLRRGLRRSSRIIRLFRI
jgi:hypothetical protein